MTFAGRCTRDPTSYIQGRQAGDHRKERPDIFGPRHENFHEALYFPCLKYRKA